MWIRYIIPEDGDDQAHPNAFKFDSRSTSEVSITEIIKAFPIPGSYHFRFLKNLGNISVWMDVVDNNQSIPVPQGGIFLKASRTVDAVPYLPEQNVATDNNSRSTAQIQRPTGNTAQSPKPAPQPVQDFESDKLLSFADEPSSISSQPPITVNAAAPSSVFDNDLLGFTDSQHAQPTSNSSKVSMDLFGLDTIQPTPQSNNTNNRMNMNPNTSQRIPMGGMGGPPAMGNNFQNLGSMNTASNPMMARMNPSTMGAKPGNYDPFDSINNNNMSGRGAYGGAPGRGMSGMPPRR